MRALQLQLLNLNDLKAKELKKQNRMIAILQQEHFRLNEKVQNIENGPHAKQSLIVCKYIHKIHVQNHI